MARRRRYRLSSCGFASPRLIYVFFSLLLSHFFVSAFLFSPVNFDSYRLYFWFMFGQLLKHHVVAGSVQSSSLQNNGVMQSLLGTPLRVKFYESEDNEWRPLKVNVLLLLFIILERVSFFLCVCVCRGMFRADQFSTALDVLAQKPNGK